MGTIQNQNNSQKQRQANPILQNAPRLVQKENIKKLIALFAFTVIYGTIVGFLRLGWMDGVAGYVSLIPLLWSPVILIHFVIKTVVLLWAFFLVGWSFRARWMIFVPILAYEFSLLGGGIFRGIWDLLDRDLFRYLSLHFLPQESSVGHEQDTAFLVPFAFALAFCIVLGTRYLTHLRTDRWKMRLIAAIALLVVVPVSAFTIINKIGPPLYVAEQRAQDTIYIASTDTVFSNGEHVAYPAIEHISGTYQDVDDLSYKLIFPTSNRSTEASCGKPIQKTQAGHTYTSKTQGRSNGSHTEQVYCFVIGSYQYTLKRPSWLNGTAYQQKYPAAEVIDAIHKGKPIVMECEKNLSYISSYGRSITLLGKAVCDDASVQQIRDIYKKYAEKLEVTCESGTYSPASNQRVCDKIVRQ